MDEAKPEPAIDGCTHWVLEDHEGLQVGIFKITGSIDHIVGRMKVRCIWARKDSTFRPKEYYDILIKDMISQKKIPPKGLCWRPVGDIEDLFIELKDA